MNNGADHDMPDVELRFSGRALVSRRSHALPNRWYDDRLLYRVSKDSCNVLGTLSELSERSRCCVHPGVFHVGHRVS